MLVDEEAVLEQIFRHAPTGLCFFHEDTPMIQDQEARAQEKFGEMVPFSEHPNIRSPEHVKSSSMAVELAENAKLHVLHITAEEELKLFDLIMHGLRRKLAFITFGLNQSYPP